MKKNPLDFDYILFRYLYAVKETISDDTYKQVSNYKQNKFIKYMGELSLTLNNNQKMLFMDNMFTFSRYEVEKLKISEREQTLKMWGTLREGDSSYYYPDTEVFFDNIKVECVRNGYKEKVSLDSVLSMNLYLQALQPFYDEDNKKHKVDMYVSLNMYDPKYNDIIQENALSNIFHIRFQYENCGAETGSRKIDYSPFEKNLDEVIKDELDDEIDN